jgi:hypothetical protein
LLLAAFVAALGLSGGLSGAEAQGQGQIQAQSPPARLPPLKVLKSPSPEALARLFPATARTAGVEGGATVACVIRRDGTLGDCEVTGENPRGLGFGEAARAAMAHYQVSVDGPNAAQVSRRLSGITIRFALPPGEMAAK